MHSPLNALPAGPLTAQAIVAPLAEVATRLLVAVDCAFCSGPVTSAAFVGADEAEALLRRLTGRLS